MDDRWCGAGPRGLHGWALVAGLSIAGCSIGPTVMECPRGQQRHDGQCVPTSSLVFERCLESFRKTRVQRAHGVDTELTAKVEGQGGSLRRERTDTEQAEYDGLPDELMGEAIGECRRQEQQQRSLELERAWAAVDEADDRADAAHQELREAVRARRRAESDASRHEQTAVVLAEELEATRASLEQTESDLQEQRTMMVEHHPCTAEAWDECAEQALVAKREGDYARAHDTYRLACEGGSTDACGNWGVMFEHGLGVAADPMEARRLYEHACEAGGQHACVNLGFLHEQGYGAPRDLDRAVTLYRGACRDDQMRGCGRLGRLLATGAHPSAGLPAAGTLLDRACEGDYVQACLWAGEHLVAGHDAERHPARAARRFRRACEHDVPEACVTLGRMHELGDGVREDLAEASELYRRACEAEDPRGCAAVERLSRAREIERNTELTAHRHDAPIDGV